MSRLLRVPDDVCRENLKGGVDLWFPYPGRSSLWDFLRAKKKRLLKQKNKYGSIPHSDSDLESCDSWEWDEYDLMDALAASDQSTSSDTSTSTDNSDNSPSKSTWTDSSTDTSTDGVKSPTSTESVKSFSSTVTDKCTDAVELSLPVVSVTLESRESPLPTVEDIIDGPLKGGRLDVLSFLSNHGRTTDLVRSDGQPVGLADAVLGKYVLICCVSMPVFRRSKASEICHSLKAAYSELPRNLFEIVFVPKMRPGFDDRDKEYFDSFFSHFHCLAVPFHDVDTRRHICSTLAFNPPPRSWFNLDSILVDPSGCILHHRVAAACFRAYGGSEWFPFTDDKLDDLDAHDEALEIRLDPVYARRRAISPQTSAVVEAAGSTPLSLHRDLLLCDPSLVLSRIDPATGDSMTVSDLSNKLVGLYLCLDGRFMETLDAVHKQCLSNGQELEIVLVCLPLLFDPREYQSDLDQALKLCNITSWFVFPFCGHVKACRRLWRVFARQLNEDRLIILPPADSQYPGEMEGRAVLEEVVRNEEMGVTEYPFIRSIILKDGLSRPLL